MRCFHGSFRKLVAFIFFISCGISGSGQNVDVNLLKYINLHRSEKMDPFFRSVTNSTYPISLAIPVALLGAGFIKKDSALKNHGFQVGAALVMTAVVTEGLKLTIQRQRPFLTYPVIQKSGEGDGSSFPSGHVSIAFTTATSLSLLNHKWYVVVPSFLWASTIAYSRLDLGVHYPSDVLAGAIIGSGSALLSYKVNHWLHRKIK